MQTATVPQDESARLDALNQHEALDTPPEEAFDGLTRLASQICGASLHQSDIVIVPDATQDSRFADNPLVTENPHIRFYAGAPLITPGREISMEISLNVLQDQSDPAQRFICIAEM